MKIALKMHPEFALAQAYLTTLQQALKEYGSQETVAEFLLQTNQGHFLVEGSETVGSIRTTVPRRPSKKSKSTIIHQTELLLLEGDSEAKTFRVWFAATTFPEAAPHMASSCETILCRYDHMDNSPCAAGSLLAEFAFHFLTTGEAEDGEVMESGMQEEEDIGDGMIITRSPRLLELIETLLKSPDIQLDKSA